MTPVFVVTFGDIIGAVVLASTLIALALFYGIDAFMTWRWKRRKKGEQK